MKTHGSSVLLLAAVFAAAAPPAHSQDVTEPGSGVKFAAREGDQVLLGLGLRTRTFLRVKVYAIGLYVADAALSGPLTAFRGQTSSPAFYKAFTSALFGVWLGDKPIQDDIKKGLVSRAGELIP